MRRLSHQRARAGETQPSVHAVALALEGEREPAAGPNHHRPPRAADRPPRTRPGSHSSSPMPYRSGPQHAPCRSHLCSCRDDRGTKHKRGCTPLSVTATSVSVGREYTTIVRRERELDHARCVVPAHYSPTHPKQPLHLIPGVRPEGLTELARLRAEIEARDRQET